MSGFAHKYWACPFFEDDGLRRSDGRRTLRCEGGSRLVFYDKVCFDRYADFYCCRNWKACSMARSLLLYYDTAGDAPAPEREENAGSGAK